jgi:uncharacterized protein
MVLRTRKKQKAKIMFEQMHVSISELQQQADKGDAKAQFDLARYYSLGIDDADADLAFTWFKKAAEQDWTEAQYFLARCYHDGMGIEQNNQLAFEWFRKAAEQGFAYAQYWLACCYHKGKGVEQNNELTLAWVTKAVEQTDAHIHLNKYGRDYSKCVAEAYLLLGEIYAQGKGVEQSDETAFKWYEKASEIDVADVPEAQYRLTLCYFEGRGVKQNDELALEWFEIALGQTIEDRFFCDLERREVEIFYSWLENAYLRLAFPYLTDKEDAELSYKKAFEWCTNEIEQRNEKLDLRFGEAYFCLGILYAFGKGTARNDELAFECFNEATSTYIYCDSSNETTVSELANFYLMICYASGKGVEKNMDLARRYKKRYKLELYPSFRISVSNIDYFLKTP